MLKTIARHIVAVIMAAITAPLVNALIWLGAAVETIEGILVRIEEVLLILLVVAAYAVWEKILKPFWMRWFGEIQPGETSIS